MLKIRSPTVVVVIRPACKETLRTLSKKSSWICEMGSSVAICFVVCFLAAIYLFVCHFLVFYMFGSVCVSVCERVFTF